MAFAQNPYFKKVFSVVNNRMRWVFSCQLETLEGNVCNIHNKNFASLLKHFEKKHKFYFHHTQVCHNCEWLMDSSCAIVAHYKHHLYVGLSVFDDSIGTSCTGCYNHLIHMRNPPPELSCTSTKPDQDLDPINI